MKTLKKIMILAAGYAFIVAILISCSDFLDAKPDEKLAIPTKLKDLEALMNNDVDINQTFPGEIEESADNYYLSDDVFNAIPSITGDFAQNVYLWKDKYLFDEDSKINAWLYTYKGVYTSNTVLEGLEKIEQTSANYEYYNSIRGRALFLRALRYYYGVQIWTPVYNENTATADMGLPLKINTDFNEKTVRANVEDTYNLITEDLKYAIQLLPAATPVSKTIPNKAAAYGLMARTLLTMGRYDDAGKYADSCLSLQDDLLDYSVLDSLLPYPIARFNKEIVFDAALTSTMLNPSRAKIAPDLYSSYDSNDLRRTLFFAENEDGSFRFKGGYNADYNLFAGIATDEMYLIRAEANVRSGKVEEALQDLNTILRRCWKPGAFVAIEITDQSSLLNVIVSERRKQLLYRGLRWSDLRRLNLEGANITLQRMINGQTYELTPGSARYTLPIPDDVIRISGIPQNP